MRRLMTSMPICTYKIILVTLSVLFLELVYPIFHNGSAGVFCFYNLVDNVINDNCELYSILRKKKTASS